MEWIRSLILGREPLSLNLWFLGYRFSTAVVLQSYSLSVGVPLPLLGDAKLASLPCPERQWVFLQLPPTGPYAESNQSSAAVSATGCFLRTVSSPYLQLLASFDG